MHRKLPTCALVAALVAPGLTFAGERLSNGDLTALYTDQTLVGEHRKHGPTKTYYGPNGRVESQSMGGKTRVGKWWIDDATNTRCVRWDDNNKDLCHYVERNPDGSHALIHSQKGHRIVEIKEVLPGKQL
jgi:hypothetical protein